MNPIATTSMLAAIVVATVTASWLPRCAEPSEAQRRYSAMDGLRGYLAFFVFLHHSAYWYGDLHSGEWSTSSSLVFHLGKSSVLLFFMATGFLFWSKLLHDRTQPIDWTRLYVSRVLRLAPLYWFVTLLLFVVVAQQSHWTLVDSPFKLAQGSLRWLVFNIFDGGDLNQVRETWRIVAGVTWTLKSEWFFYLALPAFGLLIGRRPPIGYLLMSFAVLAAGLSTFASMRQLAAFGAGMVSAWLVQSPTICRWASGKVASLGVIGLLTATVGLGPTIDGWLPIVLLSFAFALIACGNDLFGLLARPAARKLGEISYSIYLLHGMLLYVVFQILIGRESAAAMSLTEHWLLVVGLASVLVAICGVTFHAIERPAMNLTPRVTAGIRAQRTQSVLSSRTRESSDRSLTTSATVVRDIPVLSVPALATVKCDA